MIYMYARSSEKGVRTFKVQEVTNCRATLCKQMKLEQGEMLGEFR